MTSLYSESWPGVNNMQMKSANVNLPESKNEVEMALVVCTKSVATSLRETLLTVKLTLLRLESPTK